MDKKIVSAKIFTTHLPNLTPQKPEPKGKRLMTPLRLYISSLSRKEYNSLTLEEQRELGWRLINDGDEDARKDLYNSCLRMAVNIAKTHKRKWKPTGLDLLDLIQEGNKGVIRATYTWDPAFGPSFAFIASMWIEKEIRKALIKKGTIDAFSLPPKVFRFINNQKAREYLDGCDINGTEYDLSILKEMYVSLDSQILGTGATSNTRITRTIRHALDYRKAIPSARFGSSNGNAGPNNEEISIDKESSLGVEDHILGRLALKDDARRINEIVKGLSLPPHYLQVLNLRFGLDGGEQMTLEEVGNFMGCRRQNIHRIEAQALERIRDYCIKNEITFDCLDGQLVI